MSKIIVIICIILATSLSACGNSSTTKSEPTTVVGTWTSGDGMTAHISNGAIQIDFVEGDDSGLYWKGTFDTSVVNGGKVVSQADKVALEESMLGSEDATKEFTYENGELVFTFGIMGTTHVVHLKR